MAQDNLEELINNLKAKLLNEFGKEDAEVLYNKYAVSFNKEYLIDYPAEEIIADIAKIEQLTEAQPYAINISPGSKQQQRIWQVKLLKLNDPVSLSRGLPIIENFGVKLFDEHPYTAKLADGSIIYVCDFGVEVPVEVLDKLTDQNIITNLEQAIVAAFSRQIENDALNKLVLYSGLTANQVIIFRAITHYLMQTALPFSKQYLAQCLREYSNIAANLYRLFDAKFNVVKHDLNLALQIKADIVSELDDVSNLDDDRILKAFLVVIEAMLRTNYYQVDNNGLAKSYISFKLESKELDFLPKPLPLYEIFVYSLRFEAIHLRGGKVARGGLRWSDRREDFRTEVLGLVKAQMVKNSVIVPTGSKGGFVCKKLPAVSHREAYIAEGIRCYKNFIAGLLDITDNLVSGKIVPPANVIRYDDDDPYLVVAADKGTATFSDYANEMSLQYNFWLGDAFASGGSAGYDHKKIGITAKGAWESVRRNFRHLGIDTQTTNFTVIGIGDMSGDVFGNGMLLSKHICLIAAFNHQHIFLDPSPNPLVSFNERERLFNLPRSSWADYNKSIISEGGGVFERSLKSVPLSKQVKEWLNLEVDELTPSGLIKCILSAKADMLYNGGIGTYIKAVPESNEQVKDKANDLIRVNGRDLQVKVVAEGGNLGCTQLGRIEFAKCGGSIFTDAIDNSAGVDCSDHEVNIKILFADIMQKTNMPLTKRNQILELMTENVAQLVLRDNYLQTGVLRYALARASELFSITTNFIEKLEKRGEIDRSVEYLPSYHEITERQRAGLGLTMPELSVLLAYSKITLKHSILASSLFDDNTVFDELLVNYFPTYLQENFAEDIEQHYLRKEILATQLANLVVNRMGITFASRFEDEFSGGICTILQAFWAVYKLLDADRLFTLTEELDSKIDADMQTHMHILLKKALERTMRWTLRSFKTGNDILSLINDFGDEVRYLFDVLPQIINTAEYPEVASIEQKLASGGVPLPIALILSRASYIPQLLDIVTLTHETKHKLQAVAENYFYIGRILRIDWLRKHLIALPENNKWQALSRSALITDGYSLYTLVMKSALAATAINDDDFAKTWVKNEVGKLKQVNDMFDELQNYKVLDLAMLSAIVRELHRILAK